VTAEYCRRDGGVSGCVRGAITLGSADFGSGRDDEHLHRRVGE
jgi:hypothetical protein